MGETGEQLIHRVYRRWNEGEREFDPEIMDPEVEVHSALAGNVFKGEAGLLSWVAEIDDQFETWQLDIREIREVEPNRFIVHGSIHARGRGSGLDLEQPASWFVVVSDGRVREIRNFIGPGAEQEASAER